jgi:hypothetical protein
MGTKSIYQRLARLEEQMMPTDEIKVWQIVITDSDGTKTLGDRIEWSPRSRQAKRLQAGGIHNRILA